MCEQENQVAADDAGEIEKQKVIQRMIDAYDRDIRRLNDRIANHCTCAWKRFDDAVNGRKTKPLTDADFAEHEAMKRELRDLIDRKEQNMDRLRVCNRNIDILSRKMYHALLRERDGEKEQVEEEKKEKETK